MPTRDLVRWIPGLRSSIGMLHRARDDDDVLCRYQILDLNRFDIVGRREPEDLSIEEELRF